MLDVTQAMSQMLPSLRMTAAVLEEQLGSLSPGGGMTSVAEAAQLDATIDAVKVRPGIAFAPTACFGNGATFRSVIVFLQCVANLKQSAYGLSQRIECSKFASSDGRLRRELVTAMVTPF